MALEKEKLQKIIVIGAGATMVCALYYNLVIDMIQNKSIKELKTKVTETQSRLEKARNNEKRWKILTATCAADHPFLAAQESKLINGDRVAWLWSEMGDFAVKEKMNRLAVVPDAATPNGLPESESYIPSGAALNLTCGYHKLGEFVQDLENAYPTLQVQHIEILGGSETAPETHTIRLQFQLLAMRDDVNTGADQTTKVAQVQRKKE